MPTVFDVTTWRVPSRPSLRAHDDVGAVINDIVRQVKSEQRDPAHKPGAVVYIPPGDYSLKTRAVIDVSYLQVKGSGHGFTSLGIRDGTPDTSRWYETAAGGSHVRVENTDGHSEAFLVTRGGQPRLSSVEFRDFCIDGSPASGLRGPLTRTGIDCASDNDAFRVVGMGFVYLAHALVVRNADALAVTGNFVVECTDCIELLGAGQACLVSGNHLGAGGGGSAIRAEQHFGLLVTGNNVFPRGRSLVSLQDCRDSSISNNRLHSFAAGLVDMEGSCDRILVTGNHLRRDSEAGPPDRGSRDDLYGLVHVRGSSNLVTANLFALDVPAARARPAGAAPTAVLVASGSDNVVSGNAVAATGPVRSVVLDASTRRTKVLDSGTEEQLLAYSTDYAFRATP